MMAGSGPIHADVMDERTMKAASDEDVDDRPTRRVKPGGDRPPGHDDEAIGRA